MGNEAADLVVVGKITTVFGVKGWLKIHSYTEPMENILGYESLFLNRNGRWQPVEFEDFKRHQKGLIGLIKGIDDRDKARVYCQCELAVDAAEMPPLEDGDFYWHQLEGMQVYSTGTEGQQRLLGIVDHMMETGSNDVMVVRQCQGSIDDRERLIPWLPEQVIKTVDEQARTIVVDWDPDF